jgi:hypothetical protein
VAREATYARRTSEQAAHNISAVTGIGAFAAYFYALQRRWPIDDREALGVGGLWSAATVVFEFGFGRHVAKKPWPELLADYDLRHGRTWPLVVAWIGAGPLIMRRLTRRV